MSERDPNWADEELRRELDSLPMDAEEQREAMYGDLGLPEEAMVRRDKFEEEYEYDEDDEEEEDFDLEDEFEHDFGFGEELED